jgi:hypothetical protein
VSLYSFTLNPTGTELEVTFERKVQVMRAAELDSLIAQLGELRSRMEPAIPTEQAKVTSAHAVGDFFFRRMGEGPDTVPVKSGALFLFQSPRFGWFQWPASPELCAGLAKWLQTGKPDDAPAA